MTEITVKIPRELMEKMLTMSHINWSEVIKGAIEKEVKEEMKKAAEKIDKIMEQMKPLPPGTIVMWIREDRGSR